MKTYSILRTKEDSELARVHLTGRVVDLGGHKGSSYYSILNSLEPVEVANFDSEEAGTHKVNSGADHIIDLEKPFPFLNATFDHVLCINVMEHIYNFKNLATESSRILTSDGTMYVSVPFFFNIHASPNDYFRYTKSALERIFSDAGFARVIVTELGDGPCSAIFQNFGGSIPTLFLKLLFTTIAIAIDTTLSKLSNRYRGIRYRVPLGYFVVAHKK